jgi:hypothetical protein
MFEKVVIALAAIALGSFLLLFIIACLYGVYGILSEIF